MLRKEDIATVKEAQNGANNDKAITPYTLQKAVIVDYIKPVKLLTTPLQSSSTIDTFVTATLIDNYTDYDEIVIYVQRQAMSLFPKLQSNLELNYYMQFYSGSYYYSAKAILFDNNKIQFKIHFQGNWANNDFYVNDVIGIKY